MAQQLHQSTVPPALAGERLDKAIAALFEALSRGLARRLIDAGAVRLDGARVRAASRPVRPGQRLEVGYDPAALSRAEASRDAPSALRILAERPGVLVLDKPPGVHTQGTAYGARGTLEDQVACWLRERQPGSRRHRPFVGVVHRLDADTSGVVALATHREAAIFLQEALRRRRVERGYVALIEGIPADPSGTIHLPLTRRTGGRVRPAPLGDGRAATTHYRVVATDPARGLSQLAIRLETGRQHQIRVHLAETVGPVVGDSLYGSGRRPGRLRLHAASLRLPLPPARGAGRGQEWLEVRVDPDPDFFAHLDA